MARLTNGAKLGFRAEQTAFKLLLQGGFSKAKQLAYTNSKRDADQENPACPEYIQQNRRAGKMNAKIDCGATHFGLWPHFAADYTEIKGKDTKNKANAAENPGSFETETQISPEDGYDFSYHNLVCPLSEFVKRYGYEEYMPYLCNLDYVLFGMLGVPLFREHTCFKSDYCDFKLKVGAKTMPYWPPVFSQGKGYK